VKVFGTNKVPIKNTAAEFTDLPGLAGTLVYFLDLTQLSRGQLFRLKAHLCQTLNVELEALNAEIEKDGVALIYEDLQIVMDDWQEVKDDHHLRHV
jgi:hypothetical protein